MKKKDVKAAILTLLCTIYGYMPWGYAQTQPKVAATGSQIRITGIVSDDMGVLPDVAVFIKGSKIGTLTDFDGAYEIDAQPQDILVFSYVGYTTVETVVGARNVIHIKLVQEVTALKGVEVNAGYYTVKEREQTGNIAKVGQNAIEQQAVSNPLAALQGRVAGVEVNQTSGIPGAGFEIKIRGQNSIRSEANEPLYIIDGVPFSSATLGEQQASGIILPGSGISPLNHLNPMDIQSIEILKDADATAIYGSRGANGVVLITTKKGTSGSDVFRINMATSLGQVAHKIDLLDTQEYITMRKEAFANDGITDLPSNAYDINGTWDQSRQTNWQKKLFGNTAYASNLQASYSGGTAQTNYLLSGNFNSQTTVFPDDFKNDKIAVLANINHHSQNDKVRFQFSANYSSDKNYLPATNLVLEAYSLPPNAPELYNDDGTLNWENSTWSNPLRLLEETYKQNSTNLISNASIQYAITGGLSLDARFGYTESHLKEIREIPSTVYNPAFGLGSESSVSYHNSGDRTSWILEPQFNWKFDWGSTQFQSLLGMTFQEQNSNRLSQLAYGFTNNNLIESIAAASNTLVLGDIEQQYRYNALFGRLNINHKGKYILNITGRRDGSSRFGPEKRFSNFGAIGATWLFSNEKFIAANFPSLSFGKLRGSYGTSGSDQIGDYQYLDTFSFGFSTYQGIIGLQPTRLFNPNFSWEANKKLEFGLDLGFFNDRISFSTSHYRNRSSNQLVGIPLPSTTGFNSLNSNLSATVENTGWELLLHTINLTGKKWNWSTSLNLTIPKNRLVAFPNLEGSTYSNQLAIGHPLNILKLYESNGVDPQTGIYRFTDFNVDNRLSSPDDNLIIKDLNPQYFGGMEHQISYGKFKMDLLVQFTKQLGQNFESSRGIPGGLFNQSKEVVQRWQNTGDQASIQRYSTGQQSEPLAAFLNYVASDATIIDASYIRLKTLSLSYQLTEKESKGFGCQLFIRGQNLWTWTTYDGLDPETRSSATVPPLRFVTIGAKFNF